MTVSLFYIFVLRIFVLQGERGVIEIWLMVFVQPNMVCVRAKIVLTGQLDGGQLEKLNWALLITCSTGPTFEYISSGFILTYMYTSCLFPGDQIVSVNGNPVLGKSYSQVIELIVSRSVIRSQKCLLH